MTDHREGPPPQQALSGPGTVDEAGGLGLGLKMSVRREGKRTPEVTKCNPLKRSRDACKQGFPHRNSDSDVSSLAILFYSIAYLIEVCSCKLFCFMFCFLFPVFFPPLYWGLLFLLLSFSFHCFARPFFFPFLFDLVNNVAPKDSLGLCYARLIRQRGGERRGKR